MNDAAPPRSQVESRIDKAAAGAIVLHSAPGNLITIAPQNMAELFEFAKLMAISGECIPQIFRNKPGACLAIALQAFRTGADPFAVANKAYMVNDRVAYEAQYILATINTSGALKKRLRPVYEGTGDHLKCIVSGEIVGENEPFSYQSPEIGHIPIKNSPLWKNDPDQQLFYYASRAWARRYLPEVILGMDTGGDIEMAGQMRDVTPPPRPKRDDPGFYDPEPEPEPEVQLYELINCDGETVTCTADSVEDNLLAIFAEAQKRGNEAIEAAIENNKDAAPLSAQLQHEFQMLRAYLARSKEPEQNPPDPPAVPPPANVSPRRPASTPMPAPSPEEASYIVAPVYDRTGAITYRAWWMGAFMNRVRKATTSEEVTKCKNANDEMIKGYYATLTPTARITAMKELDDIQKTLPTSW